MPRPSERKQPGPESEASKGVPLNNRWTGSSLLNHYHKLGPSALCAAVLFGKDGKPVSGGLKKK